MKGPLLRGLDNGKGGAAGGGCPLQAFESLTYVIL